MKLTYRSRKERENVERALSKLSPEIARFFAGRATITIGSERQRFVSQIVRRGLFPPDHEGYVDSGETEIVLRLAPYDEPQHD